MKDSFTFFNELILFPKDDKTDSQDDMSDDGEPAEYEHREMVPDKRIINNILSYSRALNVLRTKQTGDVRLLMN